MEHPESIGIDEIPYVDEIGEEIAQTGSPSTKKRKMKLRSKMWDHFVKMPLRPGESKEAEKARCLQCGKHVPCYGKIAGTSGMLQHYKRCPRLQRKRQTTIGEFQAKFTYDASSTAGGKVGTLKLDTFDEKKARKALAHFIILCELPFLLVEKRGFKNFVRVLKPRFKVISRHTVARDCMGVYISDMNVFKEKMLELSPRVCLTMGTWTSVQNITYMCVTTHFIDTHWQLHRRVIGFRKITDHKGKSLSKQLEKVMVEWGIEKVLTITVDNASNNDRCLDYLRDQQLRKFGEKVGGVTLNHDNLHMRCAAHILNLVVQDGLNEIDHSVQRMRMMVKYVKSSPQWEESFKNCVKAKGLQSKGFLQLDVCTRWNSTFAMLKSVEKHQAAFEEMLELEDGHLLEYLTDVKVEDKNGTKVALGAPTQHDWECTKQFIGFLGLFYEATLVFSASKTCTAYIFFRELERIKKQMDIFMMSEDHNFSEMAKKMHDKYAKYWGGFTTGHPRLRINIFLYVAIVLEPKFKIRWFEYWFPRTLSDVHSKEAIAMVKRTVEDLFQEYNLTYGRSSTGPDEAGSSAAYSEGFGAFIAQITESDQHTELDQYLMEKNEHLTASYDILLWWKLNESKYLVLARMARDVLAIPITTVPSESAFSMGGRVLSAFRSSLEPRTVEGLICTQNWMNEDIETEILDHCDGTEDPDACLLDSELETNPTSMVVGVGLDDLRIQDQSGSSVAFES